MVDSIWNFLYLWIIFLIIIIILKKRIHKGNTYTHMYQLSGGFVHLWTLPVSKTLLLNNILYHRTFANYFTFTIFVNYAWAIFLKSFFYSMLLLYVNNLTKCSIYSCTNLRRTCRFIFIGFISCEMYNKYDQPIKLIQTKYIYTKEIKIIKKENTNRKFI